MLTATDLRVLRHRYGVTQVKFARMLGVPPSRVERWEQGRHVPDPPAMVALMRLARELGAPTSRIPLAPKAMKAIVRHAAHELLSTPTAAKWLGVSAYTLHEWARRGLVRSIQYKFRGPRHFRLADLETFQRAHYQGVGTASKPETV